MVLVKEGALSVGWSSMVRMAVLENHHDNQSDLRNTMNRGAANVAGAANVVSEPICIDDDDPDFELESCILAQSVDYDSDAADITVIADESLDEKIEQFNKRIKHCYFTSLFNSLLLILTLIFFSPPLKLNIFLYPMPVAKPYGLGSSLESLKHQTFSRFYFIVITKMLWRWHDPNHVVNFPSILTSVTIGFKNKWTWAVSRSNGSVRMTCSLISLLKFYLILCSISLKTFLLKIICDFTYSSYCYFVQVKWWEC